jgi:hypothetical protein
MYENLARLISSGAEIRRTPLDTEQDWAGFTRDHPAALPLFAVDERSRLVFAVAGGKFEPANGWTVFALHPAGAH